jgi:hypothetical protein
MYVTRHQHLEDPRFIIECMRRGCKCQFDMGVAQASIDSSECTRHNDNGMDDGSVPDTFGADGAKAVCRYCEGEQLSNAKVRRKLAQARKYANLHIQALECTHWSAHTLLVRSRIGRYEYNFLKLAGTLIFC